MGVRRTGTRGAIPFLLALGWAYTVALGWVMVWDMTR
jgi:hypothetical protein